MGSGSFAEGLVGIVLDGRYRLDAVLGEGGMGAVFRAQHLAMDRRVAVKLLKPHLTQDAAALARFTREARATLKVESEHAVKVLDFGITPHGDYYIALEYLDGRTVQRELDIDGPFAPARVIHIARQALGALAAAHKIGLVHRDIKPDNILLMRVGDDPDYAKLLDFGVAKLMEGTAVSEHSRMALTAAGMVFGTPEFMSPEQACGHPLDGRSDLYSLAATMFAMLTGCALYEAKTPIEWLTHHARTPPPNLAMLQPELAAMPALDALLQRCLAKQRDQRPSSADEMDALLAKLEPYVSSGGTLATPSQNALKSTIAASSSYVPALPQDMIDPGATMLPARTPTPLPALAPMRPPTLDPGTTGMMLAATSRRGLYLAIGAVAVLALLVVVVIIAVRKPHARAAAPVDAPALATAAPDAAVLVDAPSLAVAEDARGLHADARAVVASRPPVTRPAGTSAARAHLDAAEEAMRANNRLRQLAEADLALKADPRNVRATYLLADALIKTGDLDRGCAYLRTLGRNLVAVSRARAAGCPAASPGD